MKTIVYFIFPLLLVACACTKSAVKKLPPATQTGANTFGCLINGMPFRATRATPPGMSGLSDGTVSYSINLSYPGLFINVSPWERNSPIGIRINIPDFKGLGTYKDEEFLFNMLPVDPNTNSYVNITKHENGILSGTFQAKVTYNNETYSITHGRFDIKDRFSN